MALAEMDYGGEFEVIVVVDGSTDETADALRQLSCPFPLRVITQANCGQAAARNRGADAAAGDIILFLDDDMVAEPELLEQHAKMHRAGADAVTGEVPVHPDSPPGFVTDALAAAAAWQRKPPVSAFHVYSGNLSVAKTVLREIGGFDEEFCRGGYGGEDLDLGMRLVGRYDVRHNEAAVAWQKSSVRPRDHMRRARELARSDVRLIAKHPHVRKELLANRGAPGPGPASLSFRLSGVPLLGSMLVLLASWSAEIASRTPLRSNGIIARLYFGAR